MSRGINKVILIGNLGHDPEIRYTPSGVAITCLRLATSEVWKDKTTGEQQEITQWHYVVLFNKLAEIAAKYLKKGSKTYIEGSLRTIKWQDKEGADRYSTEILATEFQMLDSKHLSSDNYEDIPYKQKNSINPAIYNNSFCGEGVCNKNCVNAYSNLI